MNRAISAIILAAGSSSRMGKPKQLLPLGERTILEHVINYTINENFLEIITVIGHEASKLCNEITVDDQRFRWVVNEAYHRGQSTSLKLGIDMLQENIRHFMVFLGDLPFISPRTIKLIYRTGEKLALTKKEPFIIQAEYESVQGHPVFFGNIDRTFFAQLKGDQGAKGIMNQIQFHKNLIVKDKGIVFDIDTPRDYLLAKKITNCRCL